MHVFVLQQCKVFNRKKNPPNEDDRTHASSENHDQPYWISSVDEYADEVQYGPEVSSPIAGATKMFYQKPLKPDRQFKS